MKFILSLVLLVATVDVFAVKKNVCSITLNSSEEIELFKKHLSKKDFTFTELTLTQPQKAKGSDSEESEDEKEAPTVNSDWLMESCRQGIKCDVLVVSGHFGGTFFGNSGLQLPLEELESASCEKMCEGIIKRPKETFLFGCNTLAGKSTDSRTPEQYMQVLINDGFSREQAQQVAAFRYSPFGNSFSDRMRRTFSETPRIYGFTSVGPSGKTSSPLLSNYLKQTAPRYSDYISKITDAPNQTFLNSFKNSAVAQQSGNHEGNAPICYLESKKVSNVNKINYMNEIATKGGLLQIAPHAVKFFESLNTEKLNTEEINALKQVQANTNGQKQIEGFLQQAIPGLLRPQINILNLAMKLNWINKEKYNEALQNLALSPLYRSQALTINEKDEICSLNIHVSGIDMKKVSEINWRNTKFIQTLSCLGVSEDDVVNRIIANYSAPTSDTELRFATITFLIENKVSPEKLNGVFNQALNSKNLTHYGLQSLSKIALKSKYNNLSMAHMIYSRMTNEKDSDMASGYFDLYIALTNQIPEAIANTVDYLFSSKINLEQFTQKSTTEVVTQALASSELAMNKIKQYLTVNSSEQQTLKALVFFRKAQYKVDSEVDSLINLIKNKQTSLLVRLQALNYLVENTIQSEVLKNVLLNEIKIPQSTIHISFNISQILLKMLDIEEYNNLMSNETNAQIKVAMLMAKAVSEEYSSKVSNAEAKKLFSDYFKTLKPSDIEAAIKKVNGEDWKSQDVRYISFIPDTNMLGADFENMEEFQLFEASTLLVTKTHEVVKVDIESRVCGSNFVNYSREYVSGCLDFSKTENTNFYLDSITYRRSTSYSSGYEYDPKTAKVYQILSEKLLNEALEKIEKAVSAKSVKFKTIMSKTHQDGISFKRVKGNTYIVSVFYSDYTGEFEQTMSVDATFELDGDVLKIIDTKEKIE